MSIKWLIKIINKLLGNSERKVFNKSDLEYQDGDNT